MKQREVREVRRKNEPDGKAGGKIILAAALLAALLLVLSLVCCEAQWQRPVYVRHGDIIFLPDENN